MGYRLYNYWRSSSSWRVRIALAHKQIPYEYVAVNLLEGAHRGDDHRARNPRTTVPVLEIDSGGQLHLLAESLAILEYLEEVHPERPLLPRDPLARAEVRRLAEIINAGIQPLQNLATQRYLKEVAGADPAAFTRHFVGEGLTALEQVARRTAGTFLFGNEVTLADACLIPQLYGARRFGVPLEAYETLLRVEQAAVELPAFVASHPDRQPDAPAASSS